MSKRKRKHQVRSKSHRKKSTRSIRKSKYSPKVKSEKSFAKPVKIVIGILTTLSILVSIASFILSFLPDITVNPEPRLDPNDPFWTPFVISNGGYTSIHDVFYYCKLRQATNSVAGKVIAYDKGVRPIRLPLPSIEPGESTAVGLPFSWISQDEPIISADFDFVLKYRPSYYPFKREKSFRSATATSQEKGLIWLPRTLSER